MKLIIKPIVNSLFHATVSHEGFEATGIGYTKDEAAKKALECLKREVEFYYKAEEAESSDIEIDKESDLDDIEDSLCDKEILKDKIWKTLEEEVQEFAIEVAKIAFRAALGYAIKASIAGSTGGLFF